jgi:hypothetical protein
VEVLKSKTVQIEDIRTRTIFVVLESDTNRAKREYVKLTSVNELLPNDIRTSQMIVCYQATEDILKAKYVYDTMDIVEVWELLSVKLACNYDDPYKKRKEN